MVVAAVKLFFKLRTAFRTACARNFPANRPAVSPAGIFRNVSHDRLQIDFGQMGLVRILFFNRRQIRRRFGRLGFEKSFPRRSANVGGGHGRFGETTGCGCGGWIIGVGAGGCAFLTPLLNCASIRFAGITSSTCESSDFWLRGKESRADEQNHQQQQVKSRRGDDAFFLQAVHLSGSVRNE